MSNEHEETPLERLKKDHDARVAEARQFKEAEESQQESQRRLVDVPTPPPAPERKS
jgi:hypothetical protein